VPTGSIDLTETAHRMSASGQSRPNQSAPVPTFVRYAHNSGQTWVRLNCPLSAKSRLMQCNMFGAKRKTASRRPIRNSIRCFDQVASILQKNGARRERPQLGSCLTAATRESRSRRAVRVFPLCYRPSVCDSNYRGMLTRWCHESPPCLLQQDIVGLDRSSTQKFRL
jgi:hypothetical protein